VAGYIVTWITLQQTITHPSINRTRRINDNTNVLARTLSQ